MKILYRNIYLASNQRIRNNGPSNCIIYAYDYYSLRTLSSRTNTYMRKSLHYETQNAINLGSSLIYVVTNIKLKAEHFCITVD